MIYAFFYIALIHGKWKPGVSDELKIRFAGYNKGNYNFVPSILYVMAEGYEEQAKLIENKVKAMLYDYLENPKHYNTPTEYVDPNNIMIDDTYIKEIAEKFILDNNFSVSKVKSEYLTEAITDTNFLDKVRMFPNKYTEKI
jgi:hypothetical protein